MLAILSDIHANLEALTVVLDDVDRRGVSATICLGDIVGYGPDPEACLSLIRGFDVVLLGNVDDAVVHENPASRSPLLDKATQWTRRQLTSESIEFLAGCKKLHKTNGCTYSHGGPLNGEYLFPEHIYDEVKMREVFSKFDGLFFCGHSHIPGIHGPAQFLSPEEVDYKYQCEGADAVVNVGSVGQPRDNDSRACYVLFDHKTVEFVRLDYDVEKTARKIKDIEP